MLMPIVQGVETTSGGHGRNEAAVIRGYKEVANVDTGFKSNPLDPGIFSLIFYFQRTYGIT